MKILRLHRMAFWRANVQLCQNWGGSLISIFAISIALTLPSFGFLLLESAENFGSKMALHEMSLFLNFNATRDDVHHIRQQLEKMPVRFQFVSKEEALQNLTKDLHWGETDPLLEKNPLPDAFVVAPLEQNVLALKKLQNVFLTWENVHQVQWDSAWAERYQAMIDLFKRLMNLLALLFFAGLIAIVFNSVRLQMMLYKDEMEVSWMMGATHHFIAAPFYYFGILLGTWGALFALLMLHILIHYLKPSVAHLAYFYDLPLQFIPITPWFVLSLLAVSIGLAYLAVYFSVHLFLRRFQ